MQKVKLLVNLPLGFFDAPVLQSAWQRLENLGEIRKTSHNTAEEIAPNLAWQKRF